MTSSQFLLVKLFGMNALKPAVLPLRHSSCRKLDSLTLQNQGAAKQQPFTASTARKQWPKAPRPNSRSYIARMPAGFRFLQWGVIGVYVAAFVHGQVSGCVCAPLLQGLAGEHLLSEVVGAVLQEVPRQLCRRSIPRVSSFSSWTYTGVEGLVLHSRFMNLYKRMTAIPHGIL